MQDNSLTIFIALHAVLVAAWAAFFSVFIHARSKTPRDSKNKQRSGRSRIGIILQGAGFFITWSLPRSPFQNLLNLPAARWNYPVLPFTLVIPAGSIWLAAAAVRVLGKQWSLTARLLESHELVTAGPYRYIRHPIYTALFGMLIGTLFIHSNWIALPLAVPIFLYGTWIRISEEDRLLAQQFGAAFKAYQDRVPALLPGIW